MQLPDPATSHAWADKILWFLGGTGVATALATIVGFILNWRKPKSEVAKIDADTEGTKAATAIKLSSQLITLHDKINFLEASIDSHQRENAETISFYRKQIIRFEQLDLAYRNRFHAVNSELGRLGLEIRQLEGCYADLHAASECAGDKRGEMPAQVSIKTYDQIVAPFPLPPAD